MRLDNRLIFLKNCSYCFGWQPVPVDYKTNVPDVGQRCQIAAKLSSIWATTNQWFDHEEKTETKKIEEVVDRSPFSH